MVAPKQILRYVCVTKMRRKNLFCRNVDVGNQSGVSSRFHAHTDFIATIACLFCQKCILSIQQNVSSLVICGDSHTLHRAHDFPFHFYFCCSSFSHELSLSLCWLLLSAPKLLCYDRVRTSSGWIVSNTHFMLAIAFAMISDAVVVHT